MLSCLLELRGQVRRGQLIRFESCALLQALCLQLGEVALRPLPLEHCRHCDVSFFQQQLFSVFEFSLRQLQVEG